MMEIFKLVVIDCKKNFKSNDSTFLLPCPANNYRNLFAKYRCRRLARAVNALQLTLR